MLAASATLSRNFALVRRGLWGCLAQYAKRCALSGGLVNVEVVFVLGYPVDILTLAAHSLYSQKVQYSDFEIVPILVIRRLWGVIWALELKLPRVQDHKLAKVSQGIKAGGEVCENCSVKGVFKVKVLPDC